MLFPSGANLISHSGSGNYENLTSLYDLTSAKTGNIQFVKDNRTSGWTPIEVDYIVVINILQMKLDGVKNDEGVSFTLLTDEQIKTQLDLWVQRRSFRNNKSTTSNSK